MKSFSGFPEGKVPMVSLPEPIFTDLIPLINDIDELKVTILIFWRLSRMRSTASPWITDKEIRADHTIRTALSIGDDWEQILDRALTQAVKRGTLLTIAHELADKSTEVRYFANSPRGRASVAALKRGETPSRFEETERPNIFTLYEQNIGPLTALISEDLADAEVTFPEAWIADAFHEAVQQNKRNWKYIYAILKRWQEEGKDEVDRRDRERDPKRYTKGKYGHLIKH